MTIGEFDLWFRTRYHRTSSALAAAAMIVADFIGVMISFGAGFFVVKIYYIMINYWGGINFKSFVTYWPYLGVFVIIFWIMGLYPGAALAPAEETRGFAIASFLAHVGINVSRYIQYEKIDSIFVAFIFSFAFSTIILMICRDIMHALISRSKMKGIPAVIFGGGATGRLVVDSMLKAKRVAYEPVLI